MNRLDKIARIVLWVLGPLLIVAGCWAIFPALFLTVVAANDTASDAAAPGMAFLLLPLAVGCVPVLILLSARKFPRLVAYHAVTMVLAWVGALYLYSQLWLHR
ncbi:MAG: hypothetical protein PW843_10430 [Azospirillaceae bacterium]|nr:hypothetical protein [Azospirillaceae bacterium]